MKRPVEPNGCQRPGVRAFHGDQAIYSNPETWCSGSHTSPFSSPGVKVLRNRFQPLVCSRNGQERVRAQCSLRSGDYIVDAYSRYVTRGAVPLSPFCEVLMSVTIGGTSQVLCILGLYTRLVRRLAAQCCQRSATGTPISVTADSDLTGMRRRA